MLTIITWYLLIGVGFNTMGNIIAYKEIKGRRPIEFVYDFVFTVFAWPVILYFGLKDKRGR